MNNLLLLIFEFMKTGLLAVGGGYATLPFLHDMAVRYDWFSVADLSQFIAISEITPGPVGINMATFAGYHAAGVGGGILASLAIATVPSILLLLLCHFIPDVTENKVMKKIFYGLIPCAIAMILAAGISLFGNALLSFDDITTTIFGFLLFGGLCYLSFRKKLHPFFLLLIGGIFGFFLL